MLFKFLKTLPRRKKELLYRINNRDNLCKGSGYYFRIFKVVGINIIGADYLLETFSFSRIWRKIRMV